MAEECLGYKTNFGLKLNFTPVAEVRKMTRVAGTAGGRRVPLRPPLFCPRPSSCSADSFRLPGRFPGESEKTPGRFRRAHVILPAELKKKTRGWSRRLKTKVASAAGGDFVYCQFHASADLALQLATAARGHRVPLFL